MSAAAQTATTEPVSWDTKPAATDYQQILSAAPTASIIPKTVDYGHGHGMKSNVDHSSYETDFVGEVWGCCWPLTLVVFMFQILEPLLNGSLMARELCWGLTQCRQTGVMKKVSFNIVFFSSQSLLFYFFSIDELYNSRSRTSGSKRSLQQRPILWKTSRPLHWAPRVQ